LSFVFILTLLVRLLLQKNFVNTLSKTQTKTFEKPVNHFIYSLFQTYRPSIGSRSELQLVLCEGLLLRYFLYDPGHKAESALDSFLKQLLSQRLSFCFYYEIPNFSESTVEDCDPFFRKFLRKFLMNFIGIFSGAKCWTALSEQGLDQTGFNRSKKRLKRNQ